MKWTRVWVLAALICAGLGLSSEASATTEIKIATLAPKNSAWGKFFVKLDKKIRQKTGDEVGLRVYYNGVQGDEGAMVSKLKTGQIDAAALTSVGLSRIYKNVMVLQLPGVLDTWKLLDKARKKMRKELEGGFEKEGFTVVGWGDLGRVRLMSKGFAVRKPSDLQGKKPVAWRDEPMAPVIYGMIGQVTPTPLGPTEVLPNLRSGAVNVLSAPPLAAEQLQWTPQLDHIGADSTVCAIGGTVIRTQTLEKMPEDTRKLVLKLQRRYGKRGAKKIRKLDDAAYTRLAKKMKVVKLTQAERAEWEKLLRKAVTKLGQGTFPKELVDRVVKISGKK